MKLQFKHQKFQADAAKAVCDVFAGQPYLTGSYVMDQGSGAYQMGMEEAESFTGWRNQKLIPALHDHIILEQIQNIQRANQIAPSPKLEGRYHLTIEMETGVGKTYTYIKTMFELNKRYGWSKFIVVVPSVAIREGVYKTFQITQEHFAEEYGKKIRFFIYHSARLTEIDRFASDSAINVMIINAQAFNARGKDARRIYMKLDAFRSRRPIDIIASTNPILIIDEPQSVEGKQTKERLKEFHPLFTLRYSATHRPDSLYHLIYRLDAMEAYNKRLVKQIAVKGVTATGSAATKSYVYLEGVHLSEANPAATIQFDYRGANGIRKITRKVGIGYSLYEHSGEMVKLEEYRDGFVVKSIDGRDNSIEFLNGIRLFAGDVLGDVSEEQLRRIQIRETILSHLEREKQLFYKGIKVLSLFFIDEVANYKQYDAAGHPYNGIYADMFEQEYAEIVSEIFLQQEEDGYVRYLKAIQPADTHAGYFSVDKKGKMTDSKLSDKKEKVSDDIDAYDLIMKNKELLLDRNPKKSPVRFLFSHSALREGWDNPNVFQICTLKQSNSDVRKRQEVGRGLRLCVNQDGERMDVHVLGEEVHQINILTVIASESYDSFSRGLQTELAEAVADRPRAVTAALFQNKIIYDKQGNEQVIDGELAQAIYFDMIVNGYIDKKGLFTERYYEAKANGALLITEEAADCAESIVKILDSLYDSRGMQPINARDQNITLQIEKEKLIMPAFQDLWSKISRKSVYTVDFDTEAFIRKAVSALDKRLRVSKIYFKVEAGTMIEMKTKEALLEGTSFTKEKASIYNTNDIAINHSIKYDLIGKLVDETGLTRRALIAILTGIKPSVFAQFKDNPEDFILKAAALINEEKAAAIVQHITYHALDSYYDTDIFTAATIKGKLGVNAIKVNKHLYDYVVYDSANECDFAKALDASDNVAVYVKLPKGYYISTPVGRYSPDWAIVFHQDKAKYFCFVAETKGSTSSMQLRLIEQAKIHCAKKHFEAISNGDIVYDVVDSYQSLLERVK